MKKHQKLINTYSGTIVDISSVPSDKTSKNYTLPSPAASKPEIKSVTFLMENEDLSKSFQRTIPFSVLKDAGIKANDIMVYGIPKKGVSLTQGVFSYEKSSGGTGYYSTYRINDV